MNAAGVACKRVVITAALAVSALGMTGCDPCAGIAQCSSDGYLAVDGQIVEAADGRGVDGVRVDVIRRAGASVERDSISVSTTAGGHWRAQFMPTAAGGIDVDVRVTPMGGVAYEVKNVRLDARARAGDATVLERWVAVPYFPAVGELFVRGSVDTRVANAVTEFRRTNGVALFGSGVDNGVIRSTTDLSGRVALFSLKGGTVLGGGLGEVVGDLTVRRSATDSSVARGVRISSTHVYRTPAQIIRLGVGPSLLYVVEFFDRARGGRLGGVQVEFQHTGGVATNVASFSGTSGADGRFAFSIMPLAAGMLTGRLIFRAPVLSTPETLLVSIPTFEDDGARLFRVIGAGTHLPYYGIFLAGRDGLDGVKVDVKRVGGIAVLPEAFTTETANGGIFAIRPVPLAFGELVVDITFRPPAPYQALVVRGLRLTTVDRPANDRLIGVFSAPGTTTPAFGSAARLP